jgi:mannose-6-phosphate isomerase-like protein (cupin superfamily)
LVALGHTALVAPWSDPVVHRHRESEETYLLLQGELRVQVGDDVIGLRPREALMVRPHVPHAVVRGTGPIEHFGLRAPASEDKEIVGQRLSGRPPSASKSGRELREAWGYRIPLHAAANQNCWLLGAGEARFRSAHLILAYLRFPTTGAANEGIGTRHRLHYHEDCWEYYVVLEGSKTLQVEDELVRIQAGELLEVRPRTRHGIRARGAPYEGVTFRVPVRLDDKVLC